MLKISEKIGFWDRIEFKMKTAEEDCHYKGWQAALMTEFMVYRAAMTAEGAHSFVTAKDKFKIAFRTVTKFLNKMRDEGWLKTHKELKAKKNQPRHARRKRQVFSPAFQLGQLSYEIIIHEKEESLEELLLLREDIDKKIKRLSEEE